MYDPHSDRWSSIEPAPFHARGASSASAVSVGEEAFVTISGEITEAAILNVKAGVWRSLPRPPIPSGSLISLTWTGRTILLVASDADETSVISFDPSQGVWTRLPSPPASGRQGVSPVWTGREMVWVRPASSSSSTGIAFDPVSLQWRTFDIEGRCSTDRGAWTGSVVVSLSGTLNLTTNRCEPLPPQVSTETGREYFGAVWTGEDYVVWGGSRGATFLSDGLAFTP